MTTPSFPLIGLIGRKRTGKNTFSRLLVDGHGFTEAAFADPLREVALAVNPIIEVVDEGSCADPECCVPVYVDRRYADVLAEYGYEVAKDRYPEVRRFLQVLGTDAVRDIIGEDTWVDLAGARMDARTGPLVLTDVRFPNEAEAITERGGYLVRVVRPGQDESDLHPSETALDDWPVNLTLHNDGTLEEFLETSRPIAKSLAHILPRS